MTPNRSYMVPLNDKKLIDSWLLGEAPAVVFPACIYGGRRAPGIDAHRPGPARRNLNMPVKTLTLKIKVKPGAKTESLVATEDGTWVASVKAQPVDGKANAALLALVARHFAVARSAVQLKSGAGSRLKLVQVHGAQDDGTETASTGRR